MDALFLVEEKSMKLVLDQLLPKLFSPAFKFKIIPHAGKQDLIKAIPSLAKTYKPSPNVLVVLMDKDSTPDCKALKNRLLQLCTAHSNPLVRIVCTELESWLLGDLAAIDRAFSTNLQDRQQQNKYRNPDALGNAKQEFMYLIEEKRIVQKRLAVIQQVAVHLNPNQNTSTSFNVFISGLKDKLAL